MSRILSPDGIHPAGERGLLVDLPTQEAVHRLADRLMRGALADAIEEVVPGGRTVLVLARGDLAALREALAAFVLDGGPETDRGHTVEIPIVYAGPDLEEVCAHTGLTPGELAALHSGTEHTVAFFGFTPGFPYLSGAPDPLRIPRRSAPRVRVGEGSVAIANGYTVIYPGGTPGGWSLIGTVDCPPLWDLDRDPPNLLSIGDRIVFRERR